MATDVARIRSVDQKGVSAPGALSAIRIIARREIAEQLSSARFLIIALLVIGLTPLAVYVGARDYKSRFEDYNRLVAEQQKMIAGPAGKEVAGFDKHWTQENDLAIFRAIRPPEPVSALVRGLDGALPQYWDFSPTGIVTGPLASRPQRIADVVGHLDMEFLMRVALGLLAILLAFDAVAGEKELGTLRAVLSQPISRAALLTGKLAGGAVTLLVPLAVAFLVALISAQLFGVDLIAAGALTKVAMLALTAGAYLVCFYALGLMVSSLASSQKTSLVVLLVVWVVAVLAIPPIATMVAQAASPVPTSQSLETRKDALDSDIRRQAELEMGTVYREITGDPEDSVWTESYFKNKEAIDRRIVPIEVGYLNKRRQFLDEIDRDAERRAANQNRFARLLMAVSPAAAFAGAATDLAGTGDAQYAAWIESVHRYQDTLNAALFDDPPSVIIRNKGASFDAEIRKLPSVADLPSFAPPRRDAAAALSRSLPAIGLLGLFTGVFIIGGFFAFSRYDVR
ncbi:MAG TPA: ABC transporter permease subunit [Blastocatellia bacterium]